MIRRAASIGLAALLLGCAPQHAAPAAKGREAVRFNMSWLPQGGMGGVIAAIDQGYYAAAGLDVSVMRGFGGVRTVNELDQGLFDFAYGDPISVALSHANGGTARMIGPLNAHWPAGLCYVRERHRIARPADLAGLIVGGGQNSPMQALVPAWLRRNGVAPRAVTLYQIDPALVATSLIEARIDAGECWSGNSLALFRKRAREAGVTIGFLPYAGFHFDIYGGGLLASARTIAARPAMVRRFVAATYRGYEFAAAHPDAATAMMVARFPTLDPAITRQQLTETTALMRGAGQDFRAEGTARTIDFLNQAYGFDPALATQDVFAALGPGRP